MRVSRITEFQDILLSRGVSGDDSAAKEILKAEYSATEEELLEYFGNGPLEEFFQNQSITEILVNGPEEIWVEKNGALEKTSKKFSCENSLKKYVRRILSARGRKVDQRSPFADCTLLDGSRLHVSIPPSASRILLSIRKFRTSGWTLKNLFEQEMFNQETFNYLKTAVSERKNIFVCGGTGSGKTSLLGAMITEVSSAQRILSLEDIAEIRSDHPHFLSLEARPANIEGEGEIEIRRLLRESLRMRPDRIVVGECRGPEALDLILALNTGHKGSMATIHANSPREALRRLETLAMLVSENLGESAVKNLIGSSVDLIIHLEKRGQRKIASIAELKGVDGGNYLLKESRF